MLGRLGCGKALETEGKRCSKRLARSRLFLIFSGPCAILLGVLLAVLVAPLPPRLGFTHPAAAWLAATVLAAPCTAAPGWATACLPSPPPGSVCAPPLWPNRCPPTPQRTVVAELSAQAGAEAQQKVSACLARSSQAYGSSSALVK